MPEADKEGERYATDRKQATPGFFLKGSHQLDWGMKNRLARTFNPASGRTVMLAVDHGYFQGPTTGLERIDLSIVPLLPAVRRAVLHARHTAQRHPGQVAEADGAAGERRPQHPARGAVRRADRHGHGRRRAPQRGGRRHPGIHRRRARDPLRAQHDQAGGRRPARRHARHGHHRGRQGDGAQRASISGLPAASSPSWAPSTSRPTTWRRTSRPSRPPARCRSSWPAARSCPSSRRSPWPTTP